MTSTASEMGRMPSLQQPLHPVGARRRGVDASHGACHVARAAGPTAHGVVVGQPHLVAAAVGRGRLEPGGIDRVGEGAARAERVLATQPAQAEAVPAVGRHVDLDHDVVEAEQRQRVVAHRDAGDLLGGQHDDAVVVGADAEARASRRSCRR
ncbi:hypothetical protein GCM10025868_06260 [Angustibacter aerolatus]|uniref:Uncharacterized protein n=1 Tax=Angustibacter aerolatus TaxID=1162965 RepID=A0ABQ6JB14_9ACTN|nr:hypothetical protein GCM10025868_06260 [Angustibacter aerolatus]